MAEHEYEVGGTVSVTLRDGTRIVDSPLTRGPSSGSLRIAEGMIHFWYAYSRLLGNKIKSVDSYTPPKPEWDRPEVRIIKQTFAPFRKAYRETCYGEPTEGYWTYIEEGCLYSYTTARLVPLGPWEVYGVAPETESS